MKKAGMSAVILAASPLVIVGSAGFFAGLTALFIVRILIDLWRADEA